MNPKQSSTASESRCPHFEQHQCLRARVGSDGGGTRRVQQCCRIFNAFCQLLHQLGDVETLGQHVLPDVVVLLFSLGLVVYQPLLLGVRHFEIGLLIHAPLMSDVPWCGLCERRPYYIFKLLLHLMSIN